jgi:PAS domain S-box-containing protein
MKKSVTKGFTAIIVLMLSIFSAIIFLSFHQSAEAKATAAMVAHTHEVMFQTAGILSIIKDNESGSRGYILTGRPEFLAPLQKSNENIYREIETLRFLTKDNPSQQLCVDSLLYYINKKILFSDTSIEIRNKKGLDAAINLVSFGNGTWYMDNISRLAAGMQQAENSLLKTREAANEKATARLNRTIIFIIIVILVLIIILSRRDYIIARERKTVEQTLRKNELYLDLMANNLKDYAIFMLDANGLIVSWNRGSETVLGYDNWEVKGKSFSLLFTQKDNADDEPVRNLALAKKYGQYETEGTRIKKDGQSFIANMVLTALINDNGAFYGYSVIIRDITEKKKIQQQLEFLSRQITHSNDSIYMVDSDTKIKSWNRGAEILYGYKTWEVLDRDPNEILKTSISKEELKDALKIINKEDHWTGELKRQTKDGKIIFVHSSTSTIRDNRGNITGYVAVSFDITNQKELHAKVNHLASLVEQSTEAIISTGLDNRVISWNNGAEELYQVPKTDAIGKNFTSLGITNKDGNDLSVLFKQAFEKATVKTEMNFIRKDGTSFFGVITASVVKDEQGEIKSVVYIINDISLRHQMEEKLQKSNEELEQRVKERTEEIYKNEQRFRALIENSTEGIALIDETGEIFYRSPAAYKITGEVPLGKTMELIHPEDKEMVKNKHLDSLKQPAIPLSWQGRFQHSSGEYIWMEGTLTNLMHISGVNAVVANYRNISERKKAEEELIRSEKLYRNLFENMLHGFSYCKTEFADGRLKDFTYLGVNHEYEKMTGLKNVQGKRLSDIDPDFLKTDNEYAAVITRVSQGGNPEKIESYVKPLDAWFSASLYSPEKGYFVTLIDNITETKRQEHRIKKLNEELEARVIKRTRQLKKTNEELEAFSYSVSHDLRAPLRAIIGFTAILEEDYCNKLDDEAKRITSIIKSNTLKMGHLIDDLLTFSRMGRQDIVKTNINTCEMVNEIINQPDVTQYINGKKIKWNIHSLPNINGDSITMRQVWINLISNAVKYSGKTSLPEIEIGSFIKEGKTIFFIKDNGVGFDEKYKSKLFRVFQRLHSADEFEGTGIGLAIVEKIISKHDGNVWAEAAAGKGATFYFNLPSYE